MAKFRPAYTADDILTLYRVRKDEGDESRMRRLSTEFRQYCRMEHNVTIPKQYQAITKKVITPFIRDAHLRITSSLVAKPPVCHITPRDSDRQDYRDAANIGERVAMAIIERLSKEIGRDIVWDLAAAHVRDGESVLKVVHRPDAWARFPTMEDTESADDYSKRKRDYKRGADLPIAWRVVDRQCVVYEGGDYGDAWVCEYGEFAKPHLRSQYGVVDSDRGRLVNPRTMQEGPSLHEGLAASSTGRAVKLEFWTSHEWHVLIDGSEAPGWPRPNPYAPHLPYFRAPAYEMESLLYSLMFLAPRMDELLTMKLNWSYLGAYPTPVIETIPNASGLPQLDGPLGNPGDIAASEKPKRLSWTPGKAMYLPPGQRFSFVSPPPIGGDLNDLITIFKSLIDIAGVPSVMRGVSGSGDSGYLASQMRAAAEMSFKLSLLALQRQLEKAMEFTLWLVPNVIQQTVYVLGWDEINPKTGRPRRNAQNAWIGISPDHGTKNIADYSKIGPISFQYRPTLPTDEQARAMIALQLTNANDPLYSKRDALETWMQEEDPDDILDNIMVEKALNEEPLRSRWMEEALREAGMLPQQEQPPAQPPMIYGPNGAPMSPGMQGGAVPLANQAPPGMPGVPGLTMPLTPQTPQPQGITGNTGGRERGMYPGQPGGPNRQ